MKKYIRDNKSSVQQFVDYLGDLIHGHVQIILRIYGEG